jgi:hypothetical protein
MHLAREAPRPRVPRAGRAASEEERQLDVTGALAQKDCILSNGQLRYWEGGPKELLRRVRCDRSGGSLPGVRRAAGARQRHDPSGAVSGFLKRAATMPQGAVLARMLLMLLLLPSSKRIAGLVGPMIVAMLVSEFPLVQPHLYDAQIPPVVYLSGVLMFGGGLAIVRVHNHWTRDWTILITLSGWLFLGLGLFRMFAASLYQRGAADMNKAAFMILESALLVVGLIMTFKAYRRDRPRTD